MVTLLQQQTQTNPKEVDNKWRHRKKKNLHLRLLQINCFVLLQCPPVSMKCRAHVTCLITQRLYFI